MDNDLPDRLSKDVEAMLDEFSRYMENMSVNYHGHKARGLPLLSRLQG